MELTTRFWIEMLIVIALGLFVVNQTYIYWSNVEPIRNPCGSCQALYPNIDIQSCIFPNNINVNNYGLVLINSSSLLIEKLDN